VRRATDWDNPPRVSGSFTVLERNRSRNEVNGLQELLQRIPDSRLFEREHTDRDARIEGHRLQGISVAETLSRFIRNANCSMTTNSPWTGLPRGINLRCQP